MKLNNLRRKVKFHKSFPIIFFLQIFLQNYYFSPQQLSFSHLFFYISPNMRETRTKIFIKIFLIFLSHGKGGNSKKIFPNFFGSTIIPKEEKKIKSKIKNYHALVSHPIIAIVISLRSFPRVMRLHRMMMKMS